MGQSTAGPSPIVSFTTAYARPLVSLKANITAQQAPGTPTPSSPLPISGTDSITVTQTKKNLIDPSNIIIASNPYSSMIFSKAVKMPVGNYTVSISNVANATSWRFGFRAFDSGENVITNAISNGWLSFTEPSNVSDTFSSNTAMLQSSNGTTTKCVFTITRECYMVFAIAGGDVSASTTLNYQLETGTTATTFEPYTATTFTKELPRLIYGGEVDVISGQGEETYTNLVDLSDLTWNYSGTYKVFWVALANLKNNANIICSDYETTTQTSGIADWNNKADKTIGIATTSPLRLCIKDLDYGDATSFKNALNAKAIYELATPTPISTTPTTIMPIVGQNNIFADSGDCTVTYTSFLNYYKCGQIFVTANSNVGIYTVSGAIANFSTSLELPLVACKAQIVPQQASGTPTPSSPLPISGTDTIVVTQTGKNLLNPVLLLDQVAWNILTIQLKPNTTYILSSNITSAKTSELPLYIFNSSGNPSSSNLVYNGYSVTITTLTDGIAKIQQRRVSGTDSFANYEYQLEVGNQATTFEAYQTPTTFTKELPRIIYGGEVDVLSGSGTETQVILELDGSSDEYWATYNSQNGFYLQIPDMETLNGETDYLCNFLKVTSTWTDTLAIRYGANNKFIYCLHITDNLTGVTDVETWRTYLSNNHLVITYPLATPTPFTTTPTEIKSKNGTNNIMSDSGDVEVKYKKIIT